MLRCAVPCRAVLCAAPTPHLQVYDATPFLEEHPGGAESILISAGMDATDEFNSIHSSKAKGMLKDYYIGELVTAEQKKAALAAAAAAPGKAAPMTISISADSSANGVLANGAAANGVVVTANGVAAAANGVAAAAAGELVALDPRKKIPFKLAEKIELSHNVRLFRFALQSPEHKVRHTSKTKGVGACSRGFLGDGCNSRSSAVGVGTGVASVVCCVCENRRMHRCMSAINTVVCCACVSQSTTCCVQLHQQSVCQVGPHTASSTEALGNCS